MTGTRAWRVTIPGVAVPHTTFANDGDEAVRDALYVNGLHFAPEGTAVTELASDMRTPLRPTTGE